MGLGLQDHRRSSFAVDEPVPITIEWAARSRKVVVASGQSANIIESSEEQTG